MSKALKVSIITVCLNSEKTIEKTIQSVLEQTYSNIEFIIIDGKSTDHTLEVIENYKENIDYICSEKDKGVYDAMNKGILHSTGELIAFLNSDDWYFADTVEKAVRIYQETSTDIVYGDYIFYYDSKEYYYTKCSKALEELNFHMIFGHQAMFFKKELFNILGNYNTNYRIASDYDWLLRAYHKKIKFQYLPESLCFFRNGGLCTIQKIECAEEVRKIAESYDKNKNWRDKILCNYEQNLSDAKWDIYINNVLKGSNREKFHTILYDYLEEKQAVFIFGAGQYGQQCIKWCRAMNIPILNIIDNSPNKKGTYIQGIEVIGLEKLELKKNKIIIATLNYTEQIAHQLESIGLEKGKDYCCLIDIKNRVISSI